MRFVRSVGVLLVCASFAAGCNKGDGDDLVGEQFAAAGAIVQEHGDNKVAFTVGDDGKIKAGVRDKSGDAVTSNVKGKVSWTDEDGEKQSAKLKLNKKTGLLESKKKLPASATNVDYTLSIKGDDVEGDLEVPTKTEAVAEEAAEPDEDEPVATKPTFNFKKASDQQGVAPISDDGKKKVEDDQVKSGWEKKKAAEDKKKSGWEKKKAAEEKKKAAWEKKDADKKSAWEKKKEADKKSAWEKKKEADKKSAWEKKKAAEEKKKAAWEKKAAEEKKKAAWEKKKAAEPKKSW